MTIQMTEFVRPHGEQRQIDVNGLMPETEARVREMQAAGFRLCYEVLGGGAYAFYIANDEIEYDVVTRVLMGDSKQQLADIDSAILEWTVDQLRARCDEYVREMEGEEE